MVSTDTDCSLKVDDGEGMDVLVDKPVMMRLVPGEHLLVAITKDGKDRQSQVVTVDKPAQRVVLIALLPIRQAREQEERAKKELEDAKAQEVKDELADVRAKAAQEQQQAAQKAQQEQQQAVRQQAAQARQKQISDLRSQIDDLNGQISDDEDEAQRDEQSAQEQDDDCARLNLQPGIPCVGEITANTARSMARQKRQEATELKDQVRDLESQLSNLSAAPLQIQQPLAQGAAVPQTTPDLVQSGRLHTQMGDLGHAAADFTEAIRLNAGNADAFFWRGMVYRMQGDFDRSVQDESEAIRLNPSFVPATAQRGISYLSMGDFDRAINDFNGAIQAQRSYPGALYWRGVAEFCKAQYTSAASDFEKAAESDPRFAIAGIWVDIVRARLGAGQVSTRATPATDLTAWPGPVISLFRGQLTADAVVKAATDETQTCEAHFYVAEHSLFSGDRLSAEAELKQAESACPFKSFLRKVAQIELGRLGQANQTGRDQGGTNSQHSSSQTQANQESPNHEPNLIQATPHCTWVKYQNSMAVPDDKRSQQCDDEATQFVNQLDPDEHNADAKAHLGKAFLAMGATATLHELDLAIAADPRFALAYFYRGVALRSTVPDANWTNQTYHDSTKDSAIHSLQTSLVLDPSGRYSQGVRKLLQEAGAPQLSGAEIGQILGTISSASAAKNTGQQKR